MKVGSNIGPAAAGCARPVPTPLHIRAIPTYRVYRLYDIEIVFWSSVVTQLWCVCVCVYMCVTLWVCVCVQCMCVFVCVWHCVMDISSLLCLSDALTKLHSSTPTVGCTCHYYVHACTHVQTCAYDINFVVYKNNSSYNIVYMYHKVIVFYSTVNWKFGEHSEVYKTIPCKDCHTSLIRTLYVVPVVSIVNRFHCIPQYIRHSKGSCGERVDVMLMCWNKAAVSVLPTARHLCVPCSIHHVQFMSMSRSCDTSTMLSSTCYVHVRTYVCVCTCVHPYTVTVHTLSHTHTCLWEYVQCMDVNSGRRLIVYWNTACADVYLIVRCEHATVCTFTLLLPLILSRCLSPLFLLSLPPLSLSHFLSPLAEDFNIVQQEIAILADCKHPNIIGYNGSYLR
jgi:hypothetical protein